MMNYNHGDRILRASPSSSRIGGEKRHYIRKGSSRLYSTDTQRKPRHTSRNIRLQTATTDSFVRYHARFLVATRFVARQSSDAEAAKHNSTGDKSITND